MWNYLKKAFFFLIYVVFIDMIGLAILQIGIDALEVVLAVVALGFYLFIVAVMMFKEGQESMKKLHANDLERVQMIKSGIPKKLETSKEYGAWKGFFIGFLTVAPLLLFIGIDLIIQACGSDFTIFKTIANFLYLGFSCPYQCIYDGAFNGQALYYVILYAVPVMVLLCGVLYLLGARNVKAQYDSIKKRHNQIYGE